VNHDHSEHNTYNDHYYDDDDNRVYRDGNYRDDDYYYDDQGRRRRHSHGTSSTHVETRSETRSSTRSSTTVADPYVTLGAGLGGLEASALDDGVMSGTDFNLGLGVKGTLLSGELGIHGGGYSPADPNRDVSMFGLSGDFRLQPRLGIFEPYALIGAGVHSLSDSEVELNSSGASLRLGLGLDVRVDDIGVSARYLYSGYSFDDTGNGRTADSDYNASSEQFGINLLMYF
jgi:hypothetical protein